MCNIAGYVGRKQAAPILLEMILLQEGLNGGFYSGLATHDGERLSYAKTQGDFAKLMREADLRGFAGNAGIIHSRTPSGGDGLWAHPFVSEANGEIELAYVANGTYGYYRANKAAYDAIADGLVAEGFPIPCKIKNGCESYNRLAGGEYIHMSDVMCQLIYRNTVNGMRVDRAMAAAFSEMPSEIVGLAMTKNEPERIYFSRINKPMFVGFDGDGAYLASSPAAFPESVSDCTLLPALSCGYVWADGYCVTGGVKLPERVRGYNRRTVAKAEALILGLLDSGELGAKAMMTALTKELPKNEILQADAIVYMALDRLMKKKAIDRRETTREVNGQTAPFTLFRRVEGV